MKRKLIVLIAVIVLVVVIECPILIDAFIFGNTVPSNITNGEWAGFLGSYLGAIIGAIVSLLGIAATIVFTNNQNRKDRELQVLPFFVVRYEQTDAPTRRKLSLGRLNYKCDPWQKNTDTKPHIDGMVLLQNVGVGVAIDCNISDLRINEEREYVPTLSIARETPYGRSLKIGEEASFTIHIELNCQKLSKTDFGDQIDESLPILIKDLKPGVSDRYKNFSIEMDFDYYDILGNKYRQELRFEAKYVILCYFENNTGEYTCEFNLESVSNPKKILN